MQGEVHERNRSSEMNCCFHHNFIIGDNLKRTNVEDALSIGLDMLYISGYMLFKETLQK